MVAISLRPSVADDDQTATATTQPLTEGKKMTDAEKKLQQEYRGLTNQDWKKRLTSDQYYVMREEGTERAYSSKLHDSKTDGIYVCQACGLPLFDAKAKFESGTGWPSFYQPLTSEAVGSTKDRKLFYARTEIHCERCEGHLGHVFNDAPQTPTGLRYCMNGVSLELKSRKDAETHKDDPIAPAAK